jgi:hypothetical protein
MLVQYLIGAIGICLIADGVGSICKQPDQSFFWWQFVRYARASAGVVLIAIGCLL